MGASSISWSWACPCCTAGCTSCSCAQARAEDNARTHRCVYYTIRYPSRSGHNTTHAHSTVPTAQPAHAAARCRLLLGPRCTATTTQPGQTAVCCHAYNRASPLQYAVSRKHNHICSQVMHCLQEPQLRYLSSIHWLEDCVPVHPAIVHPNPNPNTN